MVTVSSPVRAGDSPVAMVGLKTIDSIGPSSLITLDPKVNIKSYLLRSYNLLLRTFLVYVTEFVYIVISSGKGRSVGRG